MQDGQPPYQEILLEEFASRCKRNPRYSLRAFARDIDLVPSRLSEVFGGKQGLSSRRARSIAQKLGFSSLEQHRFVALVDRKHSRSQAGKLAAKAQLQLLESTEYRSLSEHDFSQVSDWYHFAILELTTVESFSSHPDWMARTLGISQPELKLAITRLKACGLLVDVAGKLKAVTTFPASSQNIPSETIKRFHTQILEKAGQALYLQPLEEREYSANLMAIDPDDLPKIKEELRKFRRGVERRYKKSPKRKAVYCLGMQFFSLTKSAPAKKEKAHE